MGGEELPARNDVTHTPSEEYAVVLVLRDGVGSLGQWTSGSRAIVLR
jgi:hypothetical protein